MINEFSDIESLELLTQDINALPEMQATFQEKTKAIRENLNAEQLNIIYAKMEDLLGKVAEKYDIPDKAVDFLRFLNKITDGQFDVDIVTTDSDMERIVGKSKKTIRRGKEELIRYLETSQLAIADIIQEDRKPTIYRVHLFKILANITLEYFKRGEVEVKALEASLYEQVNKDLPEKSEIIFSTGRLARQQQHSEKVITTKWRSAEIVAKEYLESLEEVLKVEDVSESNLGYDLEVFYKDNRKIYVEVKKVTSFNEPFKLTNNEFGYASKYGEDYYIALVIDNPFEINFISNPIAELECKRVVEKISWKFGDYTNNLQKHL